MKFLLSWLKEFIELSVPPETLAERLTLVGLEVTSLSRVEEDWLFEAEVTPNRPDLLSHLGIARETAAALGRPFRFPRWLEKEFRPLPAGGATFPVTVEDPDGCLLYCGLVIDGVHVAPSPPETVRRLARLGIRAVNNVVDITNLCLLELGQPLHAFDLSKLEGEVLTVRRARAGERLETIDGIARPLSPELLVIADSKKPVALAGIMGGRASEIGPQTKQVFLESAWFKPALIRRGTRLAKAATDSSYRFERGVHPEMVRRAAVRAARWIAREAGGKIRGPLLEIGTLPPPFHAIALKPKKVEAVLGMKSSPAQQRRLLESVGCKVTGSSRGWRVEPPSWRADLKIPEDLHEELARLLGYDRCPTTLPAVPRRVVDSGSAVFREEPRIARESRLRDQLVSSGAQEILTYSLLSSDQLSRCGLSPGLKIRNPLSAEQACLRPSLLPGALQVLSLNLRRKTDSAFFLFEVGQVYGPSKDSREYRALSLLATGSPDPRWNEKPAPRDFFSLKGIADFLSHRLGWGSLVWKKGVPAPGFFEEGALTVLLENEPAGVVGMIRPEVLSACEIPVEFPVAYAEFGLEKLLLKEPVPVMASVLAKVPPVMRDLAVVVQEEVPFERLQTAVLESGRPLIQESALFDLYRGKQVPAGKKSFAFRLAFSDGDRTLTEEEVNQAVQRVLQALQQQFQAALR